MRSAQAPFEHSAFVNCPFDDGYRPLLWALLFTVLDGGLEPRIVLEDADAGRARVRQILDLIAACRFSIHDVSRMEPPSAADHPRFNMAFELGLDLGAHAHGPARLSGKRCLVLEREQHHHRRVISDLAGHDVRAHHGDPQRLVREVRNWIRTVTGRRIRGASRIWHRYSEFMSHLSIVLLQLGFSTREMEELEVTELVEYAREWIRWRRS